MKNQIRCSEDTARDTNIGDIVRITVDKTGRTTKYHVESITKIDASWYQLDLTEAL